MLADIEAAIDAGDAVALRRTAHSFKGALSHLGAGKVAKTAEKIESLDVGETEEAQRLLAKLAKETEGLTDELESFAS